MSTAVTRGIRVSVESRYIPDRSRPQNRQYAFSYTITITNEGPFTAQLLGRYWIITDNTGGIREVQGEGVVGEQPILEPNESFRYTSWCVLPTQSGSMKGLYDMIIKTGEERGDTFKAEVAPFRLGVSESLN